MSEFENANTNTTPTPSTPVENVAPTTTETPSTPVQTITPDLQKYSNPFDIAQMLKASDAPEEKEVPETPAAPEPAQTITGQEPTPAKTVEAPVLDEESLKTIETDPDLQQLQLYEDAGYTQEEAISFVYGGQTPTAKQTPQIVDEKVPPEKIKFLQETYKDFQESDINDVKRRAQAPTDADLNEWLKAKGLELPEPPQFDDEAVNAYIKNNHQMQKNNLIGQMKQEYNYHLQNINEYSGIQQRNTAKLQAIDVAVNEKVYTLFPALKEVNTKTDAVFSVFQRQFFKKINGLAPELRTNQKLIEKIADQTLKEVTPACKVLFQKLGINAQTPAQVQPKPQAQTPLEQFKAQQMNNVNSNQSNTIVNAENQGFKLDPSDPHSIANAFKEVEKQNKK